MTDALGTLGTAWSDVVWPLAWQAAVLGVIALGLQRLLGRWSVQAALLVTGAGLLKFALPPFVRVPFAVVDRAASRLMVVPDGGLGAFAAALAVVHLGGILIYLALVARQARRVKAWRDTGSPVADPGVSRAFGDAARRLGWPADRPRPTLLWSAEVQAPVAVGAWRQAVLIPSGFAQLPAPTRRIALGHELAHHQRHDLAVEWGLVLLTAIWWWHPVARGLARAVRSLREQRADQAVVDCGLADAGEYCAALLAVAECGRDPLTLAAGVGPRHPLKARMRRLLTVSPASRHARAGALAVGWLFLLTALPAATGRWHPLRSDGLALRHDRVERHVSRDTIVVTDIVVITGND